MGLRHASIAEANAWLREFAVGVGVSEAVAGQLGAHSCKATL